MPRTAVLLAVLLLLALSAASTSASGCGSCWCVPDASHASCPTMPANASAATIATFKSLNNTGTNYALDCSPYKDSSCETTPPLANGTDESVCAFTYGADCSSYAASTYPSAAAAAAAGAVVTHLGACGVCSNAQDLAVYLSLFDMTAPGKKCGAKGLVSTSWGVRCWMDLGMTEACAKIWVYDAIHDSSECGLTCAKDLKTPYNLPPDCRLNSCLQCDEDRAGPNFKTFAGRTRRRSGLASAIQRPCASVARGISHVPCPNSTAMEAAESSEAPDQPLALPTAAPRPNILVLLIDDMGYSDLGAFGSPNNTSPHIDQLVARGLRFTHWVSGSPICTPSRASIQTGRYAVRTGCMGNVERYRVVPTPASPGGLDPAAHVSLARALKGAGYVTGMAGKWHLGINANPERLLHAPSVEAQDHRYLPSSHGYDTYLGSPYTNAPMCAMDPTTGVSDRFGSSREYCFLMANTTVVQQPLHLENHTAVITRFATEFIDGRSRAAGRGAGAARVPWFFFMSYFHVHTPLFTSRANRHRGDDGRGGVFGANVAELDDSVGEIVARLDANGVSNDTLVFLTSDNGPYQEEGWEHAGRANVYGGGQARGAPLLGRLRGGKGQVWEGGIRMPGAVVWPALMARGGATVSTFVTSLDIFPTALAVAGASLPPGYEIDGKDLTPLLRSAAAAAAATADVDGRGVVLEPPTPHDVFLHFCGFNVLAARVAGRYKLFWGTQKWYTHDAPNASVCLECCNGINPYSKLPGLAPATELCGCDGDAIEWRGNGSAQLPLLVFDIAADPMEREPLNATNWPSDASMSFAAVLAAAEAERDAVHAKVHPTPNKDGAGNCTAGLPAPARQPCCDGCEPSRVLGRCERSGKDEDGVAELAGARARCECNLL